MPGPHPLDCDSLDLALFAVGWPLLLRDLRLILDGDRADAVEKLLVAVGVEHAFVLRNNLVNFKKIVLNVHREALTLSNDLRRLAAFFREPPTKFGDEGDDGKGGNGFFHSDRYNELSDVLSTTEGAVGGCYDVRRFCKAICCVPRHPDAPTRPGTQPQPQETSFGQPFAHYRCASLLSERLPDAMKGWRLVRQARDALTRQQQLPEGLVDELNSKLSASAAAFDTLPPEASPCQFDALLDRIRTLNLPEDEAYFVRCALIARGAAKALTVTAETRRFIAALRALHGACTACEAAVGSVGCAAPPSVAATACVGAGRDHEAASTSPMEAVSTPRPASWMRRGHPIVSAYVLARKHAFIMRGLASALSSTLHWLEEMAERNDAARVMFVGTDGNWTRGTTAFAPKGFDLPRVFGRAKSIADSRSAEMIDHLAENGWPPWIRSEATADAPPRAALQTANAASGSEAADAAPAAPQRAGCTHSAQTCAHCGLAFSAVWVRERVCLGCEHRLRREGDGRCPFGGLGGRLRCEPSAWCVHDRRCLACDGWSCTACRFHQGDGTDVAALVASLQPACLFLDFDRTLCSTRGGSPLKGTHSVDEELVALCSQLAGRVHVVTRNAHVEDICTFLAAKGLPDVPVHRVPKPLAKAQVVCDDRWCKPASHDTNEQGGDDEGMERTRQGQRLDQSDVAPGRGSSSPVRPRPVVLFVDDTMGEHMRAEVRDAPHVVRFLFARSG